MRDHARQENKALKKLKILENNYCYVCQKNQRSFVFTLPCLALRQACAFGFVKMFSVIVSGRFKC